ncbi:integration host factor subunit beta [Myxococcota bacterium]|nr:integration host factor subunit beta [Myxococcota bacterium]
MTKSDLVASIAIKNPEITKKTAEGIVRLIFERMRDTLARGERIEIRGFGSFYVKSRGPRAGRNPKTGASVTVEGKRVPYFKVGKDLRERVNGEDA